MSNVERIFHSLLFEVLALILGVTVAALFLDHNKSLLTGLGIAFSVIAMAWNYFYNLIFDHYFGQERLSRGLKIRIYHAVFFELGFLIVSTPLIMWVLELNFINALLIDIGAAIFFAVYALAFNWCYDVLRHRYYAKKLTP